MVNLLEIIFFFEWKKGLLSSDSQRDATEVRGQKSYSKVLLQSLEMSPGALEAGGRGTLLCSLRSHGHRFSVMDEEEAP